MSTYESFFERDDVGDRGEEPAAESSGVDEFRQAIVTAGNDVYDSRAISEPEEEPSPAEPVDETPDSAVYQSLGVDRAELAEWGHQVGIDSYLPAPKTSDDLARNLQVASALKAGVEAREEISERDRDDAVTAALEQLAEAESDEDEYAAANALLEEAPDRVGEYLSQWFEESPEAASAWANAVAAREREATQQMQWLEWTQRTVADAAARRQYEADMAQASEQAVDEVLREGRVAPSAATLFELAQSMPPEDTSPAGMRQWEASLLRAGAELERAEATMRFKQSILDQGAYAPEFESVVHAEPDVNPRRLLPRATADEQGEAIRRGVLADETQEYSTIMDHLRKTDLGLKEAREKADAKRALQNAPFAHWLATRSR